jgi:hypothetical protein
VNTTFENQILLPQNGRNRIDGSRVISWSYTKLPDFSPNHNIL